MARFLDKLRKQGPKVANPNKKVLAGAPSEANWTKCQSCAAVLRKKTLEETTGVCPECGHHHKITAWQRLEMLSDQNSFKEWDRNLVSQDPLGFGQEYMEKLARDRSRTKLTDAILTGRCTLDGRPLAIGIMDFRFRGGSMGSVVGERISRLLERAVERRLPSVVVTSSGGARMQEGMLSLMQMARTSAAVRLVNEAGLPYITILTDPTTAGVAASFASLGDVVLAEPQAIIGFSGARVIEQTIRQKLPPGFQTSEFYLKKGFIDRVVHRAEMRSTVSNILSILGANLEIEKKGGEQ
ncbi:MAG: acetyl-CoA carboxylase, carboxyltransferase subunit beta [Vulcanimicrobiota bacterium]